MGPSTDRDLPPFFHTVLTVPIDDPPADRGFAAAAASGLIRLSWLLAADCDLLLLRKSMDQLGGIINETDPRPLRTVCLLRLPGIEVWSAAAARGRRAGGAAAGGGGL